jgi:hypothetical protein
VWQKAVVAGSSTAAIGRPHVAQPRLRPSAIGHPSVAIDRKHM